MKQLIDEIEELIQTDEYNKDKQSQLLISIYESASLEKRIEIDRCFICLCGKSLETLIEKRKIEEE
jgi:hypothetical protein